MFTVAVLGAPGVGRGLWEARVVPTTKAKSIKVDSSKGSNTGVRAHVASSHQPQRAMVVRVSALRGA